MSERGRNITLFLVVLLIVDLAGAQAYERLAPLVTPSIEPVHKRSPHYHHDLRKSVNGWSQWGPFRYRFYTNNLGFRDDRVREVPLHSEATRVLLMGDSFTKGVGVSFPESFSGILARELAPEGIEVLNAAVVSYSPTIYYQKSRYLIEELGLDVDVILVFLDISDILDEAWLADNGVARVAFEPAEPRRVTPERPLFEQIKHVGQRYSLILKAAAKLRVFLQRRFGEGSRARLSLDQDKAAWEYVAEAYREYGVRGLRRAAEQMDRLLDLANRHEIPMAIAVYPWPDEIYRRLRVSRQVGFWKTWAETRETTFIDLFPLFVDNRNPESVIRAYYIPFDYHWNAAGHRRVAEALLRGDVLDRLVAEARDGAPGQQSSPVSRLPHPDPVLGGAPGRHPIGHDRRRPRAGEGSHDRPPTGGIGAPEPLSVPGTDLGHDPHPAEAGEIGAKRVAQ
ncbi:MAG: SGNH/GDSL hydrolase family protein [Gemmatimonadota bacterium]